MSTDGQILGGGLGAVIGGILAAPTGGMSIAAGAALGFQTGMAVGGYLDPPKGPTVYGPRLGDKSVQTSTYGTMLPRFYGTVGVSGNITWLENGQLKETVRKKKQGGKGGGSKTTVKTYSYSATFILSLGIGPIAGVRRIWCGDRLIYNAGSDDLETIIASNQAATGFKIYLGTDDQLPDPRYEANVGVGNAPAYRGECYIVFYDFALADFGNTLQGAQFKVEVVTALASGVELLGQVPTPYEAGLNFSPKAYFVSPEKVVIYAPQWGNDYPPSSSWRAFEFYTSGLARTYSIPVPGETAAPPAGDTDQDGEAWNSKERFFTDGGSFSGTDGYIQQRGALVAGISETGGRTLYLTSADSAEGFGGEADEFSVATTAETFAVSASSVFALSADGVREYDSALTLVNTYVFALPPMVFPLARAEQVGTDLLLFSGHQFFPKVYRLNLTAASVDLVAELPEQLELTQDSRSVSLSNGLLVMAMYSDAEDQLKVKWYNLAAQSTQAAPLAQIVEQEVALSSLLTVSDLDTSLLTAEVRGYRVSGGSIRSALEPLQGAYPFDIIQSGYLLKAIPRGQASVMTIPWADLGASDGDTPGELIAESREMDTQLPALVSIKYLDSAREYAVAEQSKARLSTQAINRVDRELALVLTADEAAGVAEVLCELPWLERTPASFSLPPPYLALEPADVVTIVAPWATYELRLTEGNYTPSGRGEWEAKPNRAALYTSVAKGGEGVPPTGLIPLAGPSLFLPLDIPVVDETLQDAPGFVGIMTGYNPSWPGGIAMRSADGGQTWADLQAYNGLATLGYARGTLPASPGTLIDQRSLEVGLVSGELESISRDQMLLGHNYAAYGADQRWEIVRFQNAALQADGSCLLSGFVRGDRGTEWATGLHQDGDLFVLLDDPDNAFIGMAIGAIGVAATYRGVTSGASIDSAADVAMTYQGVNLECLSPVDAHGSRDGSGNFSGSFARRSRLSSSWWSNGVPAPVGETTEAYEIDVMSGATVKRTIAASSPSFSYSAANQSTDFGSPQSSITFRMYQLSATVGRGLPLEVTL